MADALDAWLAAQKAPAAPAAGGDALDAWLAAQGSGGAPPAPPPGPAEPPSAGHAFARGALQGASLGFGDEAAALIDTGVSKVPGLRTFAQMFHDASLPALDKGDVSYQERRNAYREKNKAAQEAHGTAYGAGEIAGGLATTPVLPGGGAVAGTAGRAALHGLAQGALMGAATGIGTSEADLTKGDVGGVAKDALSSAAVGGALGGGLGYLGRKIVSGAQGKEAEDLLKGVVSGEGKAGRATLKATKLVAADKEDILDTLRADKALRKVIDKPAKEALPVLHERLDQVGSRLDPHYDVVDKATGGVSIQNLVNVLDDEVARLRQTPLNEQYVKAVEGIKRSALDAWAPGMEQELAAQKRLLDMGLQSHKEIPDVLVPTRAVRAMVTRLQTRGTEVINALNPGESSKMKVDMAKMMKGFIDSHLDIAAEEGGPAVKKAVDEIRAINTRYSALANITRAVEQRGEKEATGGMSATGHFDRLFKHGGALAAVPMALHGNIPGALATAALPHALPALGAARRAATAGIAGAVRASEGAGSQAEQARTILRLIQSGVPRAAAIQAARSAAPGGMIREQAADLGAD